MKEETFLELLQTTLSGDPAVTSFCTTNLGAAQRVFVGVDRRNPPEVADGPIIFVEDGDYRLANVEELPGKYFEVNFAASFIKKGMTDNRLDGIALRHQLKRLCWAAIDDLGYDIKELTSDPEYLGEYPYFGIYWTIAFRLDASEGIEDLESGVFR